MTKPAKGNNNLTSIKKRILKSIGIVFVIILPLAIIFVIFKPFAAKKISQRIIEDYRLQENFKEQDVFDKVALMRKDAEFTFYFYFLTEDSVNEATGEAYRILDKSRRKDLLQKEIKMLQGEVNTIAMLFNHLEYSSYVFKKSLTSTL